MNELVDQGGIRPTFGYLLKLTLNDCCFGDRYTFEDVIFPQFGGHKTDFIYLL